MLELGYAGKYIQNSAPLSINKLSHLLFTKRVSPILTALPNEDVLFPDISFWQGDMDWGVFLIKGDSVIIRAGQNQWPDSKFQINWSQAKAKGIRRGAYWFYDDRVDPGRQADLFISLLESDPPEMEVWCDWENSYGGAFGSIRDVVAFMQRVEDAGYSVGMYTGYYWFISKTNPITNASQFNYLKNRPLWLAWYSDNYYNVKIPAPWASLLLWQKGTPADDWGQETQEIDMNVFNGTQQEFIDRYGGTTPEPPPDNGENMRYVLYVNTGGLNGRSSPNGSIVYPSGFRLGNTLFSNSFVLDANGVTKWYLIDKQFVNGILQPLPSNPIYAADGGTAAYLRLMEAVEGQGGLPTLTVSIGGDGYPTVEVDLVPS